MRIFFLLFLSFFLVDISFGQDLEWNVNLHGFADNQEYDKAGFPSSTNFGVRFSPELGLSIDSTSRIRLGFNSLHNFGDKHNFAKKIDPVVYYNYQNKGIDFYLGAFPRYNFLKRYPRALQRKSLLYLRPNIEGLLFNYSKKNFNQHAWIDWASKQTETDRESFVIGVSGTMKSKSIYFSHFFTLWHNALTSVQNPNDHIRDNAAFNARVGVNLSEKTFLDSLDINVGALVSFDRLRDVYDWRTPKGVLLGAHLAYRSFFIQDEFYFGEAQSIGYGDAFYNSKRYNRVDLGWNALKNKNLEASLLATFHFLPGSMSNQQVINLRYNFGGNVPLEKK